MNFPSFISLFSSSFLPLLPLFFFFASSSFSLLHFSAFSLLHFSAFFPSSLIPIDRSPHFHPLFENDEELLENKHLYGDAIADLLEEFDADPLAVRHAIRSEPLFRGEKFPSSSSFSPFFHDTLSSFCNFHFSLLLSADSYIAKTFATIIFLCDGLLSFSPSSQEEEQLEPARSLLRSNSRRFLHIAQCLPMELQMVLCHRLYLSERDLISRKLSEPAFKKLTKELLEKN